MRALLKLGKTCTVDELGLTLNKAQTTGVDLSQLDRANPSLSRKTYLDDGRGSKHLFLYHACSQSAPIHVFALFLPSGVVKLHLVDPATRRQGIPRLQELYTDLLKKRQGHYRDPASIQYPSSCEFTTTYHSKDISALKAISRELGLLENLSYMVIISSSKEQVYFDAHVPKLSRFPVLSMPKAKVHHSLDVFPWQTHVAQKMLQRYLMCGIWLDRSIALSNYYDVPIGHIDGDQALILSDISFARRLIQQDIVLWWSPTERPDLGGREGDNRPTEELQNTEFITPGCYSNVCLEVTVRNLAVNSVLHSVVVNELEGSGGTTAFDSTSRTLSAYNRGEAQRDLSLGESNVSTLTFGIMKSMIKTWLLDNVQANFEGTVTLAIDHFWRWISTSGSRLYDPSIHRFVHGLMRKTFIQMLAEFKRLGSHVIYADFSRILLATSKPPGTAHAYATYITTAVTSHELFQHMYLKTDRYYDFLLFMDSANFGGIVCDDPLALEPPAELTIEMRWNIETFLPPPIQEDFRSAIQYFIVELYKVRQKANENSRAPLGVLQNFAPDVTQQDARKAKELDATREFISRKLTRKLLRLVGSVKTKHRESVYDEDLHSQFTFPVLPGSYLTLTNPVLEFVKFTCAVIGLAEDYQVEIGLLKRNLLDLAGVREFANDAIFRNPCETLKLSNVACKMCDALHDFDFCRDPELMPDGLAVGPPKWMCRVCDSEYDRAAIEMELVRMVGIIEKSFTQQDMRCCKCKQVRSDNASRYCQCSGSYQLVVGKAEMKRKLRTVLNVAIVHSFARLKVSFESTLGNLDSEYSAPGMCAGHARELVKRDVWFGRMACFLIEIYCNVTTPCSTCFWRTQS